MEVSNSIIIPQHLKSRFECCQPKKLSSTSTSAPNIILCRVFCTLCQSQSQKKIVQSMSVLYSFIPKIAHNYKNILYLNQWENCFKVSSEIARNHLGQSINSRDIAFALLTSRPWCCPRRNITPFHNYHDMPLSKAGIQV